MADRRSISPGASDATRIGAAPCPRVSSAPHFSLPRDSRAEAKQQLAAGDVKSPQVRAAKGAVCDSILRRLGERDKLTCGGNHVDAGSRAKGVTRAATPMEGDC